jgi:hypothetical protein
MFPITSILISELIGKEVISDTVKGINSSIISIESFNINKVNDVLEELDIIKKIEIVNSLFDNHNLETDKTKVIALNNLHEISEKIMKELEEINKDIEYTKTIYFSYFRSSPYFEKLNKLKKHCYILDQRMDLVLRLS